MAARLITIPQRLFNRALLLALEQLTADLEATGQYSQRQDRQIQSLELRLETLERQLAGITKMDRCESHD